MYFSYSIIGKLQSLYTQAAIQTNDHDFPSSATGSVIPHGFYDLKRNTGYITLGTSHDTSEFACDSLFQWWVNEGIIHYPKAKSLLIRKRQLNHTFKTNLKNGRLLLPINSGGINEPISK
ncbi:ISAzo13-like element transposase-related protein [Bathymodiolus platifrons methanotrophic gill symbiont]|uniref:ISAzo13-like element transposase-related protein n=1 Tax=Bathymodiolus platifrons methanotrophic gill symbiont TaxID=113268 RepID=UPI001C8CFE58|nr:hypothetical protein [Bathymodiolus platifrons methanotrophic gill symbiont]